MRLSHIVLMYLIGAVMLIFIKEANASYCTNQVYANYKDLPAVLKVRTMQKRTVYKGQVESYCACIGRIESNNRPVTDLDIIQCAGMTNLFYTIKV